MASLQLVSYWPARKESAQQCTERLHRLFADLILCNDVFARWFKLGMSRKHALKHEVHVADIEHLRQLFAVGNEEKGMRRPQTFSGKVVGLWNGAPEETEAGLSISCGYDHPALLNCAHLTFPKHLGQLVEPAHTRAVLKAFIHAWDPEWAGIMSREAAKLRHFNASEPFVDWMVYVAQGRSPNAAIVTPPASTEILPSGLLITVQDELPTPSNPHHLRNIERIQSLVRDAWHASTEQRTL